MAFPNFSKSALLPLTKEYWVINQGRNNLQHERIFENQKQFKFQNIRAMTESNSLLGYGHNVLGK